MSPFGYAQDKEWVNCLRDGHSVFLTLHHLLASQPLNFSTIKIGYPICYIVNEQKKSPGHNPEPFRIFDLREIYRKIYLTAIPPDSPTNPVPPPNSLKLGIQSTETLTGVLGMV